MTKWAKVSKGDRVELRGKVFEVVKIKHKGKSAKVTVRGAGSTFDARVALADKVKLIADPLHGKGGEQRRWASRGEAKREGMLTGDPSVTQPPAKKYGDPWETPRDRVERKLESILGAHLVGEATDESSGYYVPPVDVSTIAAHLALFHGVDPSDYGIDGMRQVHADEHEGALKGVPLKVNHWHTESRPEVTA